jgi:hypothetical protein
MSWGQACSGTCDQRLFFFSHVTRVFFFSCGQRFFFSFFLKVAVLPLWGALSDKRSGLSFVSLLPIQSIVVSQYVQELFTLNIYITCVRYSSVMYNIYKASFSPGSVQKIIPNLLWQSRHLNGRTHDHRQV